MSHTFLQIVPAAVALLFAAWAAVCDVRTRRIPNRLVVLSIPTALVTHFAVSGWKGVGGAALAGVIAFAWISIGYAFGGVGAGDVKLLGVMGAFVGLGGLALLLFASAVAGGVFGLLTIGLHAHATRSFRSRSRLGDAPELRRYLPYAVPISCGVLAAFCQVLRSYL